MKEWESQNLISLLRLKLRVQAIKELISVWCVQGPGNTHPRFLPWAESREVKSSAQQAGVGHTACPKTEDGAGHSVSPPRRMGLAACPPAEDGARHGVSAPAEWGSLRAPSLRMGLAACPPAEDGAGPWWAPRKGALGQCDGRGQGHPGRQLICCFLHSRTKQWLWPRRGARLTQGFSPAESGSALCHFQFRFARPQQMLPHNCIHLTR